MMTMLFATCPLDRVGLLIFRPTNARAKSLSAPIELGSSSEDDSSEDGNYKDGKHDTRTPVTDPGDHASHKRQSMCFHAPISEYTC